MTFALAEIPRLAIQAAIKRATKRAQEATNKLDAQAMGELQALYKQAAADIASRIGSVSGPDGNVQLTDMQQLLAQVNARIQELGGERDILLQQKMTRSARLGASPFSTAGETDVTVSSAASMRIADEAVQFVRTFVAEDGLQMSDRIWRLDRHARDIVGNAIEQAIIQGHGAAQAAREFLARGMAVPGDMAAKMGMANGQKLGKAAAELLTGAGGPMDNAMRLFRTEINRAHGIAFQRAASEHPDAVGTRFLLSPAHPKPDICDLLASQNIHGLGPGVYPFGKSPWPAHPNTLSYEEVVFKDEVSQEDLAGKETPMQALEKLTPAQRIGVLGVNKHEAFKVGALTQGMIRAPWKTVKTRLDKISEGAKQAALKKEVHSAIKDVAKEAGEAALARSIEKAMERAAESQLNQISAAKKGFESQALGALKKSGGISDVMPASQILAKVKQEAAALKTKKQLNDALSKYKQAALAGKNPPPAAMAAFNSLTEIEQQSFLKKIEGAKQAAEKAPAGASLAFGDFVQVGPQRGSNTGGLYQHKKTGEQWYIKIPASEDVSRNEVLAAQLYKAAGIDVPELSLISVNGRMGVASRIITGLESNPAALKAGKIQGAMDGFAVDAWLANWDVVGLNFDNLLVKEGRAFRVDTGGALRYRAQGGLKGSAWGQTVPELDTLRNAQTNPQSSAIFGQVSKAQLQASALRVKAIADDDIRRLVKEFGPIDAKENLALAETLIARKNNLVKRLLSDDTAVPLPADFSARVTQAEYLLVRDSRINGYSLPTDKGDIEDQQVLLWIEKGADGKPRTMASLKLTGEAPVRMEKLLQAAGAAESFNDGGVFDAVISAVKGIASQAAKGDAVRTKDIDRVKAAVSLYDKTLKSLADAAEHESFKRHFEPWLQALQESARMPSNRAAYWKTPGNAILQRFTPPPKVADPSAIKFTRHAGDFELKQITNGNAAGTGKTAFSTGYYYQAEIDGAMVRYWPDRSDIPFALRNKMEVLLPGESRAETGKVFASIERLGINSQRATDLDREELYLRQVAYHRRDGFDAFNKTAAGIDDQPQRVAAMRAWLGQQIGKDITSSPLYKPEGVYQAFGHGRAHAYRPDLLGKEWDKFQGKHVLHHSVTQGGLVDSIERILSSGGQMAPTVDKLRRGLPIGGMSPTADLETGGANYFFTRIQTRDRAYHSEGINWKPRLLGRLDAISYNHDAYGRVTEGYALKNRRTGMDEWAQAAKSSSNETIFKNSLSLFDDVDSIMVQPSHYNALLQVFRRHGYNKWPDGRELTDVVKKIGSV